MSERLRRESLETLISLADSLPGALYRCRNDEHWTMDFFSAGALELSGYSSEAFLAREVAFGELIVPEHRDMTWEVVQRSIAARQSWQIEYRIRRRDGAVRWMWEQGQGLFDAAGELQFLAGYIVDVEDRKAADEALAHREEELARKNALIHELSTPVLEVWEGTLVVPVIGELEAGRGEQVLGAVLEHIATRRAAWVIIDVTGMPEISTSSAGALLRLERAAKLLGARCVLTGVHPRVAQTLVQLEVALGELTIAPTLKEGLALRLRQA